MTDDNETEQPTDSVTDAKVPWSSEGPGDAPGYVNGDDDSSAPISLDAVSAVQTEGATPPEAHGDVRADSVTISQGGANSVEAKSVSITQGGAGQVRAGELSVSQGGVGVAKAESLTVSQGGSAFAVMADTASVEKGGTIFMLVSRSTSGEVRPVLDWRAALAFGGAMALGLRLLRRR